MRNLILNFIFLGILGYLGWDMYSFYNDVLSPYVQAQDEIIRIQSEIETKSKKLQDAKTFYETLEKKRQELRAMVEQLSSMKATIPEVFDQSEFVRLLSAEAKKIGINLTRIDEMPETKKEYYVEKPFTLSFKAVYVQMIAFMERLNQLEKIIRVDEYQARPRTADSSKQKYVDIDGTMRIKGFYYLGTAEDDIWKKRESDKLSAPNTGVGK
jgi:Tfp pilus assembly protein PilO